MKVYAEQAHRMPSVLAGDYDMLPALAEIMNYPSESFSEAGLTRLDSEHQDVLFETMMNACMGDDFDVDALLGELDTAFDNLAQ